jgi:meso-butanediol dehydrogenase/(S,S)-butanediol dehydrogenase/diacetyl reductase
MVVQRRALDADAAAQPNLGAIQADLSDVSGFGDIVDRTVSTFGGLDVLVNNAGIMFERSVSAITVAEWNTMIAINLRAPVFLTQAALPHLRHSGGSIVNIGSIEGLGANPEHAAYSATKGGVHGLTRALAVDLGQFGIRVNAIAPGWIESELSQAYLDAMPDPAAARARLDALHPVGRTGSATDIGDVAVFLASGRSGFVTGETIVVDGGRTVRLSSPST